MRYLVFTAACIALIAPASAQKLTAEQIVDKYVAATGGKAAYAKIMSTVTKGTLKVVAQNINGTYEIQAKAPSQFLLRQSIAGIGDTSQGFDGTIGWSQDPFSGLRTLAGNELNQLKDQAALAHGTANWRTIYVKAELLGTAKVGTAPAYRIRMTSKSGVPQTHYYDTKSFLLVRLDVVAETPQGKIPTETYLSDYRAIDGVKTPFLMRQVVQGTAEVILTTTEVKNNVPLDDAVFAKPKEAPTPKTKT